MVELKHRGLFKFLLALNWLALLLAVVHIALLIFTSIPDWFTWLRTYLTLPILILMIWDIVLWSKGEKRTRDILLLIFLPGVWSIFFSQKILKQSQSAPSV